MTSHDSSEEDLAATPSAAAAAADDVILSASLSSATDDGDQPAVEPKLSNREPHPVNAAARVCLLALLSVVLVAALVMLAYGSTSRPVASLGVQGEAQKVQEQREEAMSVAEQFMVRINTYGPDDLSGNTMPKYRISVEKLITSKFQADFEKNVPAAEATVKQAGVARVCQVYSTGISAIDSDSATALVAGEFTNSYPKTPGSKNRISTEPEEFRVQVSLDKIHGDWLVDDFTPLTGDQSDSGSGSISPSDGASQ